MKHALLTLIFIASLAGNVYQYLNPQETIEYTTRQSECADSPWVKAGWSLADYCKTVATPATTYRAPEPLGSIPKPADNDDENLDIASVIQALKEFEDVQKKEKEDREAKRLEAYTAWCDSVEGKHEVIDGEDKCFTK